MSSGRGALATALTATAVAFIGISVVASRRRRATLEIAAVLAFWLEDAPIDELYDKADEMKRPTPFSQKHQSRSHKAAYLWRGCMHP